MKKLIELDAALEGLENLNAISFYEANEHSKEAYMETMDMLKALPTVDAVPVVHGRWKRYYCDDGLSDGWQCSVCGEWYYFGENKPNFCPNCGARMDGKEGDQNG